MDAAEIALTAQTTGSGAGRINGESVDFTELIEPELWLEII
jgi:hypothetical protein